MVNSIPVYPGRRETYVAPAGTRTLGYSVRTLITELPFIITVVTNFRLIILDVEILSYIT
jgi:hypothetical protein